MASLNPRERGITARNEGPGTQPIHNGIGDVNVHVYHQTLVSPLSISERPMHPSEHKRPEPSRLDILEWLQLRLRVQLGPNIDFLSRHEQLLGDVVDSTGSWFLLSSEFENWRRGASTSPCILWLHGIPGSGKTMLASIALQSLMQDKSCPSGAAFGYFYFQEQDDHQPTRVGIFANLVKQLLDRRESDSISKEMKSLYLKYCKQQGEPTAGEYLSVFKSEVLSFQRVYLVIDSLDSCQNSAPEKMRDQLIRDLKQLPENVRILITSKTGFLDAQELQVYQQIQVTARPGDVEMYVRSRIRGSRIQEKLLEANQPGLEESIVEGVIKATAGVFLLAQLHMDHLNKQESLGNIKSALPKLPRNIPGAFEKVIARLKQNDRRSAEDFGCSLLKHALTWIAHAATPFDASQICHSFAIQHSRNGKLDKEFIPLEAELISACAGLVTMDQQTKVLRLVHESLRDCLRKHDMLLPQADADMAKKCLTYLLFDEPYEQADRPLQTYAATYWITHVQRARVERTDDHEIEGLAIKFLKNSAKVRYAFKTMAGAEELTTGGMTGLHAAVYFDDSSWAEILLAKCRTDVNAACLDGQTALHWAVKYGRSRLVHLLLHMSAKPDLPDKRGDTPLHLAVTWSTPDNNDVISSLVTCGARVDLPGSRGRTALGWAIVYRPDSIAEALIQGLDAVDKEDGQGWTPLRYAMESSRDDLVQMLLVKKVNVNLPSTKDGWTPLRHAVQHGDEHTARQLLDAKANVGFCDTDTRRSPIWWAVYHDHLSMVKILIEYGANVNEPDVDGSTPLIEACKNKRAMIAWVLLENGAKPDIQDNTGSTALHYAIQKRERSITWLLVTKQADPNIRDKSWMSGLDWAIEKDDSATAWLLCEHHALLDVVDNSGLTALHRSAGLGNVEIVGLLLDRGAAIEEESNEGYTALHHAAANGNEATVKLLISRGAALDAKAHDGSTPLMLATRKPDEAVMRALLGLDADDSWSRSGKRANPDIRDVKGQAALHFAASSKTASLVGILNESGAKVNIQSNDGRTPLMVAVQSNCEDVVREILRGGPDTNLQDNYGRTAWEYARDNSGCLDIRMVLCRAANGGLQSI